MKDDTGLDWAATARRLDIKITLDPIWPQPDICPRTHQDAPYAGREASPISALTTRPTVAETATSTPMSSATDDSGIPPDRWMSLLPDATPVSALTIPGTHDSAARPPLPFVQTQSLSITDQLVTLGVRAFDLRLRRDPSESDRLYCYHGGVPLGPSLGSRLPLDDVMAEIWRFLEGGEDNGGAKQSSRSGETVLLLINNDNVSDSRDTAGRAAFYRAVADYVAATPPWQAGGNAAYGSAGDERAGPSTLSRTGSLPNKASLSHWYTGSRAPRLGEVRGRVVLLRRFPLPDQTGGVTPATPLGLDLSAWVNDSPDFTIVSPYNHFRIQDKWLYPKHVSLQELVASKSAHVRYMMERAATDKQRGRIKRLQTEGPGEDSADLWYLNFCSAVGERFKYGEVADPKSVAGGAFLGWKRKWQDGVNALTAEYLASSFARFSRDTSGTLGVVFMDFPELPAGNSLVRQLVQTNFPQDGNFLS